MGLLGEAVIEVGADTSRFQGDVDKGVKSSLASSAASVQNLGRKMSSVGSKMSLAITAPLVGISVAAVKSASEFDSTMNTLQAATGAPNAAMERLKKQAIDLGAKTVYSAQDAADAMLELGKSGEKSSQVLKVVPQVLNLAATEGMSMADAAGDVTSALAQFEIPSKKAGLAVNAMAGAANASKSSVSGLAESLKMVGPVAHAMGYNIQQTTGALAALSQGGLEGTLSGTALASVFNHLQPQTKKAQKAMDSLKLSFVDAKGRFDGISTVAEKLQRTFGNMPAATRKADISQIFGRNASTISAVNILIDAGKKKLDGYVHASGNQDAAAKMAQARMKGLKGALENLNGALDTAKLVLGESLAPIVSKLAGGLSNLAGMFVKMSPQARMVAIVIGGIAAAIGPVLVMAGALVASVGAIMGALAGVSLAVAAPIAVMVALGVGIGVLIAKSAAARKILVDAFDKIKAAVMPAVSQISAMMTGTLIPAFIKISPVLEKIGLILLKVFAGSVVGVIKGFVKIIVGVFDVITGVVKVFQGIFTGNWSLIWSGIKQIFVGVLTGIVGYIQVWLNWGILGLFKRGFKLLADLVLGGLTAIKGLFSLGIRGIGKTMDLIINVLTAPFRLGLSGMKALVRVGFDALKGFISNPLGAIRGIISGYFSIYRNVIGAAVGGVKSVFGAGMNALKGIAESAWGAVRGVISNGVSGAVKIVRGLPGKAASALSGVGTLLVHSGEALVKGFAAGIVNSGKDAYDAAKGVLGKVRKVFPFSPAKEGPFSGSGYTTYSGRALIRDFAVGMGSMTPKAVAAARGLLTRLNREIRDAKSARAVYNSGTWIISGFTAAIVASQSRATTAMNSLMRTLQSQGETGAVKIVRGFQKGVAALHSALDTVNGQVKTAQDNLKSARSTLSSYGSQLRDSFVSSVFSSSTTDSAPSFSGIIAQLTSARDKAKQFAVTLAGLKKLKLNQISLDQIANTGPDALGSAQALLAAGQAGVAQVNSLQKQISDSSTAAARTMYQAGVDTAQGVLNGLLRKQKAISSALSAAADDMVLKINKAVNATKGPGLTVTKTGAVKVIKPKPKSKKSRRTSSTKAAPTTKIPRHAAGTFSAAAGLSLVGERGPELIDLPGGTRVYNNRETTELLKNDGPTDLSDETIMKLAQALIAAAKIVSTRTTDAAMSDLAVMLS